MLQNAASVVLLGATAVMVSSPPALSYEKALTVRSRLAELVDLLLAAERSCLPAHVHSELEYSEYVWLLLTLVPPNHGSKLIAAGRLKHQGRYG